MRPQRVTLFRQFMVRLLPPLLATLLLALGANVLMGYSLAYKEQQTKQRILSNAFAQSLVKPLWDCDDRTATGIMESMMLTEAIDGSILRTACTEQTLRSGVTVQKFEEKRYFSTTHTLVYHDEKGRSFDVGELHIFFRPVSVMRTVVDSLWLYFAVTSLMAVTLVGVTLVIFNNLISRPLKLFQRVIRRHGVDPTYKAQLPTADRRDELFDVFSAYDRLMGTIAKQQEELILLARHDPLTGLGNRLQLGESFDEALLRARELNGTGYVLLFDLDCFKPINDTYGHAVGDAVLKIVAQRLREAVGDADVVIRLGGDEFVVIVAAQAVPRDVCEIVQHIRSRLGMPLEYAGHVFTVKTSVGVSHFDAQTESCGLLLSIADKAMYGDKVARKGSSA